MKDTVFEFIHKNRWLLLYGAFGIGTVFVNVYVYDFCARSLHWSTLYSNFCAWCLALMFSYVTNRTWVFENKKTGLKGVCRECISFIGCRLMTGVIDVLLMVVLVDGLHLYDMAVKFLTSFIVIVMNLIACKNIIFKSEDDVMDEMELVDKYIQ